MADNFFKNRNGIALGSLAAAPSNPLNGDFYYDTTLNKFRRYENGAWGSFGSGAGGGSKNYLTAYTASTASGVPNTGNGDLEGGSTAGFGLGAVTLTSNFPSGVPTFGSGASGNLSLSLISSAQLAALYSLGYISSAATTAGNFVATDAFFIDKEDQARVLAFKFAYNAFANGANGNFSGSSSNSFGVAIWDVTNAAWIQPAGVFNLVQNSGTGLCTGTFQTTSNSTQYRLVIYNANATAGAISMYFDDFSVGPQVTAAGAAMSDWKAYTPTFANITGTQTLDFAQWRRVGDSIEVRGRYTLTGAQSGASSVNISVPTGVTLTVPGAGGSNADGIYFATNGGSSLTGTTQNTIAGGFQLVKPTTGSNLTGADLNGFSQISFHFVGQVSGWSSNSDMSNDTDTRVVTLSVQGGTTALGAGTNTQVVNPTVNYDSHGGYNASTGVYTIPVTGYYDVYGYIGAAGAAGTANQAFFALLFKNGSQAFSGPSFTWNASVSLNPSAAINTTIQCNAGDTIALQGRNTTGSSISLAGGTNSTLMITRRSGPATVAAVESINGLATAPGGQSLNNATDTTILFSTKIRDTHGAYNTSTGQLTIPVSGMYMFQVQEVTNATPPAVSTQYQAKIVQTGSASRTFLVGAATGLQTGAAAGYRAGGTVLVPCLAGDVITGVFNVGQSGLTLAGGASDNFFSWSRIGN